MIPRRNISGVLPPFAGSTPIVAAGASPYVATALEFAQAFGDTSPRVRLLRGLLEYRKALRDIGVLGRQWLNGSFCEDVERIRGRSPGDIDVINLVAPPAGLTFGQLRMKHPKLFDHDHIKQTYQCDSYSVDVGRLADQVYRQLTYYFGLFSHQKVTSLWKGMVEIPLVSNDDQALKLISTIQVAP